jgi:DNA-binding Xre family transcriptional regulator
MKIDNEKFIVHLARSGMNITTLAEKSGISRVTIHKAKKGGEFQEYTIGQLASALGITVEDLAITENVRNIELPCALGDVIYTVGIFTGQIVESVVEAFTYCADDMIIQCSNGTWVSARQQLGVTVFLSYEEAERVLKDNGI